MHPTATAMWDTATSTINDFIFAAFVSTPQHSIYALEDERSFGVTPSYAHAGAAIIDQIDLGFCGELGEPDRVAVEAAIASAAVRLGFVPSPASPTPLDWHSIHLLHHLCPHYTIEAWWQAWLCAGIRTKSTNSDYAKK